MVGKHFAKVAIFIFQFIFVAQIERVCSVFSGIILFIIRTWRYRRRSRRPTIQRYSTMLPIHSLGVYSSLKHAESKTYARWQYLTALPSTIDSMPSTILMIADIEHVSLFNLKNLSSAKQQIYYIGIFLCLHRIFCGPPYALCFRPVRPSVRVCVRKCVPRAETFLQKCFTRRMW